MAGEMRYPKEGAPGWWKCEAISTGNEGWTMSKAGQVLGPVWHCGTICKVVIDITVRPSRSRGYGSMSRGFLGQAALRLEQCDMTHKSQNLGIREILQRRPVLSNIKHQSPTAMCAHNSRGTVGAVFSHWPTTKWYTKSLRADRGAPVIRARNAAMCLWTQQGTKQVI
jgi:hypothetical protein